MRMSRPPLNPTSLARKAGVDVKTIRALLSGERWPHSDTLAKIDRGLGLTEGTLEAWGAGKPAPEDAARTLDNATDVELAVALVARLKSREAGSPAH